MSSFSASTMSDNQKATVSSQNRIAAGALILLAVLLQSLRGVHALVNLDVENDIHSRFLVQSPPPYVSTETDAIGRHRLAERVPAGAVEVLLVVVHAVDVLSFMP